MTASIIVVVGTDTGVGRYLPRFDDQERQRGVLVSAYQLVLPFAIAVAVIIALFANFLATSIFHDADLAPVLRIFALTIPLAAFVRLTVGSIRGMQDAFPRVYIQNLAVPVTRFMLIGAVILVGLDSIGIAWAYTGSYIIASLLSIYYLVRKTSLFSSTNWIPMRKELLFFSAPLMITATMNMIFSNLDIFMIGAFSSTGDVGVYNATYPLAMLLSIALSACAFIFMPVISELHSNNEWNEMARTYEVVSKWIFLGTLPLFLVLVSYPQLVIRNTFGAEYVTGSLTLSILSIGFFGHAVAGPSGDMLTAIGRQKLVMYDNVLVAALNIVLNLLLIPQYSYLGAAVATTASYLLMNTIYLGFLYREVGIHPFRGSLLKPALAAGVLWVMFYWGIEMLITLTLPSFVLVQALYLLIYLVIILRFGGVEREEISLLNAFEKRMKLNLDPLRALARYFT